MQPWCPHPEREAAASAGADGQRMQPLRGRHDDTTRFSQCRRKYLIQQVVNAGAPKD